MDYYVRSTVLGGRVVTELNDGGQKDKTIVYAAGEIIAEQNLYYGGEQGLTWKHSNPITGTEVEQNTANGLTHKKEYDPFRLELGESDPHLNNAQPDYATFAGGSFYRSGGNPFDDGGGCMIDRMPGSCREAFRHLENRTGGLDPSINNRVPGYDFLPDYNDNSGDHYDPNYRNPDGTRGAVIGVINGRFVQNGTFSTLATEVTIRALIPLPQKSDPWAWSYRKLTPEEIAEQRKLLENTLSQTLCGEFVTDWLDELGRVTKTPVFNTNLLKVFDQIARTGTMTTTQENVFGRAGGSAGQGTGLVRLNLSMLATLPQGPAARAHEIAHAAAKERNPNYSYRHVDMNEAAYNVLKGYGALSFFPGNGFFDRAERNGEGTNYGGWAMDALCAGVRGIMAPGVSRPGN